RELALLWTADRVDEYLQQYRGEHNIRTPWQARERIVVGLTGGPEGRTLIRRASRMAAKGSGSEILAVYIARSDGLTAASPKELAIQRTLVEDLGGTFHHVIGDNVARDSGPDLDVHIVTHEEVARGRGLPVVRSAARLGRPRIVAGWLV